MTKESFEQWADLFSEPLLLTSRQGLVEASNRAAAEFLSRPRDTLVNRPVTELVTDSAEEVQRYLRQCARSREFMPGSLHWLRPGAEPVACRCDAALVRGETAHLLIRCRPKLETIDRFITLTEKIDQLAGEIVERRRAESLLSGQKQVLELIARSAPLSAVVEALVSIIDADSGRDSSSSLLLIDADGRHLRHGSAPGLPDSYNRAIDGIAIGPDTGSCGTAAFRRQRVIVEDIATDPLWARYRHLALTHGLRACWSTPILSASDEVLGTFAVYYREPRRPSLREIEVVDVITRTAALAIEKKLAEDQRDRQAEQLARSNAELERFAYVASHDLQEPLRMVTSYVQLLERRLAGKLDQESQEFIRFAVEGATRMADLIRGLLEFSRVGQIRPTHVAAESALQEALRLLHGQISRAGAEIAHGPLPVVWADLGLLIRVFQNLLGNAIKFCRNGRPRINIAGAEIPGAWEFSVRDNGIGIDPQYQDQVFVMFKRLHSRYPGTGIGLAVAKKIIEEHGGRIWVESAPGDGSTFHFTLPTPSPGAAGGEQRTEPAPIQR